MESTLVIRFRRSRRSLTGPGTDLEDVYQEGDDEQYPNDRPDDAASSHGYLLEYADLITRATLRPNARWD